MSKEVTSGTTPEKLFRRVLDLRREANAAKKARNWEASTTALRELMKMMKAETPVDILVDLASSLRRTGDYASALAVLKQGREVYPEDEQLIHEGELSQAKLGKVTAPAPGNVYYGATAKTYQERRETSTRWKAENAAVSKILGTLPRGIRVLDIPFGTGRFAPYYRRYKMDVVGVDVSVDMLNAARELLGDQAAQCTLEVGDALAIAHPSDSFDVVVCFRFLQNIIDFGPVKVALGEMARVTKRHALLEFDVRKTNAPPAEPIADNKPMRGLLNLSQIKDVLLAVGLTVSSHVELHDNGASTYCALLCEKAR